MSQTSLTHTATASTAQEQLSPRSRLRAAAPTIAVFAALIGVGRLGARHGLDAAEVLGAHGRRF